MTHKTDKPRDFQTERAKLREETEGKLRALEIEERIYNTVHALVSAVASLAAIPFRIHVYKLYGRIASVKFGDTVRIGLQHPSPTLETVLRIGELFPGKPLVKVKDGCLSFRTRAHVDSIPEEKKERWDSETDVCPFKVDIDTVPRADSSATFEWFADLEGIGEVEFNVCVPLHDANVGRLDIQWGNSRELGRIVKSARFLPSDSVQVVYRDGDSIAGLDSPVIRWASGSAEYVNKFTLSFVPHYDLTDSPDKLPQVSDLARSLMPEPEPVSEPAEPTERKALNPGIDELYKELTEPTDTES